MAEKREAMPGAVKLPAGARERERVAVLETTVSAHEKKIAELEKKLTALEKKGGK